MKTEPFSNRWLRILDMVGMVIAPISVSLPFFFGAILFYQEARSNGTSYTYAIVLFLGALSLLIILGYMFGGAFKSYVNHQATRDEVKAFRMGYSIFILASLIVYFMILYALFLGPNS